MRCDRTLFIPDRDFSSFQPEKNCPSLYEYQREFQSLIGILVRFNTIFCNGLNILVVVSIPDRDFSSFQHRR